jgi:membrane protease YdiL (CAAX protease family)
MIPPSHPSTVQRRLAVELIILFFLSPLLIVFGIWPKRLTMLLLAIAAVGAIAFVRNRRAGAAELGIGPASRAGLGPTLRIGLGLWLLVSLGVGAVHLAMHRPVAPLLTERPLLFALIVFIYAFSVMAQEFLFRSFFFWRYQPLTSPRVLWWLNALAFGWVHIVFGSWVSVALTLIGGALFAGLFLRYRSLLGICIVHAAFGLSIFAMGYGKYFYHGTAWVAHQLNAGAPR